MEFDIRDVTKNPKAKLGEDQVMIVEKMLETDDAGSRKYLELEKTLFASEFVKQRMADLLLMGKPFRAIGGVPNFYMSELMNDFKTLHFFGMRT